MGRPAGSWWDLKDLAPHLSVASQMDPKDVSGGQTSVNPPPPKHSVSVQPQAVCKRCVCISGGRRHTRARTQTPRHKPKRPGRHGMKE